MKSDKISYVCNEVEKVREIYYDTITNLGEYNSTFEFISALAISQHTVFTRVSTQNHRTK